MRDLEHGYLAELSKLTQLDPLLAGQARAKAAAEGVSLRKAMVDLGFVDGETAARAEARAEDLEYAPASEVAGVESIPSTVPQALAITHRFAPLRIEEGALVAAFAEPPPLAELGRLRLLLGLRIRPVLCSHEALRGFQARHFGLGADTLQRMRRDRPGPTDLARPETVFDLASTGDGEDATISHFVDQLLAEALRLRSTDLHLEPLAGTVKLRYRIDGLLQDVPVPEGLRSHYSSLVSRLKVMADLDITERRLAHDGRITLRRGGAQYDLRVSIIPTSHGESVCLRFLGRDSLLLDPAQLGMEPDQRQVMEALARLPQGLALLTGPTGSGKTTTLYALLASARDGRRKIITIEDPVEYQLDGTSQIQIRPDIGLDFAAGLRSVLRHDPDVILIGEIRDRETADAAMRAAQTGHLVFSTLHTNDSLGALTRLVDMGVEPWVVGTSLVCSVAQRLARRVCPRCAEPDLAVSPEARKEMAETLGIAPERVSAWKGRGCEHCRGTGEFGRVAIYEILLMTDELVDCLATGMRTVALRERAIQQGWRTLRQQAWRKVQTGEVSIGEVQRLTRRLQLG